MLQRPENMVKKQNVNNLILNFNGDDDVDEEDVPESERKQPSLK